MYNQFIGGKRGLLPLTQKNIADTLAGASRHSQKYALFSIHRQTVKFDYYRSIIANFHTFCQPLQIGNILGNLTEFGDNQDRVSKTGQGHQRVTE